MILLVFLPLIVYLLVLIFSAQMLPLQPWRAVFSGCTLLLVLYYASLIWNEL